MQEDLPVVLNWPLAVPLAFWKAPRGDLEGLARLGKPGTNS